MRRNSQLGKGRMWKACIVTAGVAMLATACGSSATAPKASGGVTQATNSPGYENAVAQLAKYTGATATFTQPGPTFDAKSLAGKVVYYIPVISSVAIIQSEESALQQAFTKVGVTLRVCDGQGSPSQFVACMSEAVNANAAGIIEDSIPESLIQPQIKSAAAAGIPVVVANTADPQTPTTAGTAGRVSYPYSTAGGLVADWVIEDSHSKANVLLEETTDNANTPYTVGVGMLGTFKKNCPSCVVSVKGVTLNQWPTYVQSLTQSELVSHPSINYVIDEYDGMEAYTAPAIAGGGFASRVKVAAFNGSLQQMQALASGSVLYADVGQDTYYEGYAFADQVMRLMEKLPAGHETIPLRVFDASNIRSLTLDQTSYADGSWYMSPSLVQSSYLRLWGLG